MSQFEALAANLRRNRTARGLSQREVAELAGLSRVGYRDIETGKAMPRLDTLSRVAAALGVDVPELLAPVRELEHVRFRANKRLATRENVLADVSRWLDDYEELECLLNERQAWTLQGLADELSDDGRDMVCDPDRSARRRGVQRAKHAAALARAAMGLDQEHNDGGIRDVCGCLENHGIKVLSASVKSEGLFGLSVGPRDGGPAIFINVWDRISVERWIFTAIHELGHLLLHPSAYDVSQIEEAEVEEREADAFAGYFLMPEVLFEQQWEEARGLGLVDRVFKVKRIFRVSWQSVVYRIAAALPREQQRELWQRFNAEYAEQYGQSLTRHSEPHALPPEAFSSGRPVDRVADEPARLLDVDFRETRLSRLVRSAYEQRKITLARAAEVLRLDLDDMRRRASSWTA